MQLLDRLLFSLFTDPVVNAVFNTTHLEGGDNDDFKTILRYGVADSISGAAQVYLFLLILNVGASWFHVNLPVDLRQSACPKVALTILAAVSLSTIKRLLFMQAISGTKLGRVTLYI